MEDAKGTIRSRFEDGCTTGEGGGCRRATSSGGARRRGVSAFFSNGLLAASRQLLGDAIGSFGLVLSHSVDSAGELVIVAAAPPLHVGGAFAPEPLEMVLFGSEAPLQARGQTMSIAAQEAPSPPAGDEGHLGDGGDAIGDGYGNDDPLEAGFASTSTTCMARWCGCAGATTTKTGEPKTAGARPMTRDALRRRPVGRPRAVTTLAGAAGSSLPFAKRMLRLAATRTSSRRRRSAGRTCGARPADIPAVLKRIQDDWNGGPSR